MKKLLLLLACTFICLITQAANITEEEALKKAQQFMQNKRFYHSNTHRAPIKNNSGTAYYVFNAEDNGGFVIVSGDDRMKDILGYAERGNLNQDSIPDNVRWLLDYYARIANSLPTEKMEIASSTSVYRPELQPLVRTTWDQGRPYNAHCPDIYGQQALTGCVATAMAQVINYFQWPISEVRSTAAYTTTTNRINVPGLPARRFLWSDMSDDEIAWLMRYCGQSVEMDYKVDESGARSIDIAGALVSNFNYSKTVKCVGRKSYSDNDWEEFIYNEISVGRPVIYSGFTEDGRTGHTFILHGYRDGLFYINWGWGGAFDGYFTITNLSPNEDHQFRENQDAIVAIQPASNNDDTQEDVNEVRTIHLEKAGTLPNFISEKDKYRIKKLTLSGKINGTDLALVRDMGGCLGYYNSDGQLETLDLTDAEIVKGGEEYYPGFATKNNVLGERLFYNCGALKTVILPSSITTIDKEVFLYSGLQDFTIPKRITKIEPAAFSGCMSLSSLDVEEDNPNYYSMPNSNAVFERSSGKLIIGCPVTVIPESVTTIGSYAFQNLQSMKSVKLPESLTTIEENAFEGTWLLTLMIPKNVSKIGTHAFSPGTLTSIIVDAENKNYDSRNNSNCLVETATNTVVLGCPYSFIPDGIEAIGDYAFNNSQLSYMDLPQSLKRIGKNAFSSSRLRTVEIPAGVTSLGNDAFAYNYNDLKVVKVKQATPPSAAQTAFCDISEVAKLVVPNGSKAQYKAATGWKLFSNILEESEYQNSRTLNVMPAGTLSSLISDDEKDFIEELTLTGELNPDDFLFIRENFRDGCLRILDMTNARIIDEFGEYDVLFRNALIETFSLDEVRLPNTLQSITTFSFTDSGIKTIVIPKTVVNIEHDAFYNCRRLSSISVEKGNTMFDSREDCNAIIETETNTVRLGCCSTIVPSSVVAIGDYAFSGVSGLSHVDLPDGVTSIGQLAFWGNQGLTSVKLSKSVTNLGTGPFVGCYNIKTFVIDPENPVYDSRNNCNAIIEKATNTLIQGFVTTKIPEGVVKIAPLAFEHMDLSYMEIPASVKEIGSDAFLYCNYMTTVVSHIKKPFAISSGVFSGSNMSTAVLYVPFGTKQAYATTAGWGSFPKIVEMGPTGDELNQHAVSVVDPVFGKYYAGMGGLVEVPVTMVGESIDPITNIDYTITTEGSDIFEGHLDLAEPITYMMTTDVLIPFKADSHTGEKAKSLTITKVNGLTNEATENSVSGTLVTVKRKPKFTPLVEEATGSWCGWCPRGAVGLKLLNRLFRDDVVTVAVHSGDPLELPDYLLNASGFPSCQINRGKFIDPYYGSSDQVFGIKKDVEAAMRQYTIGEIAVNADWIDDSQTAIKVNTTTTFVEDVESSPYQIGYLLLENKQTGTTSGWAQSNYYAGSNINDANLKTLTIKPSKIQDMKYDDVPVAVWESQTGVAGSLPATITSEVPMDYTYTLDISGNTRIQNKAQLTVVALLLNKVTGEVLNAAKFKFTPDPDPSVVTVTNLSRTYGDANPEFEYTVTGGALEGEPEISCEASATSPVGEYPIVIKQGSVSNEDVTFVDGMLTITKAPLTVNAGNYTMEQGEAIPKFTATYEGFKNNETEAVLTKKPVFSCDATDGCAPGEYEISISGAEAVNYTFEYVNGILTVTEVSGILEIAKGHTVDIYNTKGSLIRKNATSIEGLNKGVYILYTQDGIKRKIILK